MMNKALLIGRLATTPELRYTSNGVAVTTFRLAVQDNYRNASGGYDTQFLDIVAWRATAEFTANYLAKGRMISVDGHLRVRTWTAQDGTNRRIVEVHTNDIRALDKAPGSTAADMETPPHIADEVPTTPTEEPVVEETKNEAEPHSSRGGGTSSKPKARTRKSKKDEPVLVGATTGLESSDPFSPA